MKVFGTGLQRTGTTSLARALRMVGIPSRQFPKQLYRDLHHPVIDRFDGFTDFPIPLLFEALDRAHPGSRFIHTVRDEQSWLASVRWLFETGSWAFGWDRMPITREMQLAFYGTTTFDETRFLERYREHNQKVLDYFRERPGDLLVLRAGEGNEFARLCPFVGRDVPGHPYPHLNRSRNGIGILRQRAWRWLKGRLLGRRHTVR